MLHLLIDVIHLIGSKLTNIIYYIYIISYLIGKYILYALSQIYFGILAAFVGASIFVEEFIIFLKENILLLNNVFTSIETIVYKSFGMTFKYIQTQVNAIGNIFYTGILKTQTFFSNIFNFIGHLFSVINGAILLIGDILWYIITLGPRLIELALMNIVECIYTIANIVASLIKTFIKDIFQYSIALCAFFILLMYRHKVMNAVNLIITKFKSLIINWIGKVQRFRIRYLTLTLSTARNKETEPVKTNSLQFRPVSECVICQEQPKCILLLPCKHLCMCQECFDVYNINQLNCPICRRTIIDALPVYV